MNYRNEVGSPQQHFNVVERPALSGANGSGGKGRSATAVSTQKAPRSATPVDMAALSRTVRMACALSGRDDIRTEKILAIQQAIATGTYNVAASAVADKLMCTLLKPRN